MSCLKYLSMLVLFIGGNMVNKWSLKKKYDDIHLDFYEPDDINMLRKMIIWDINTMTDLSGCNPSVKERIVTKINQRFGYDR